MEDKYRKLYQEGNLDYTSPLNFMLNYTKLQFLQQIKYISCTPRRPTTDDRRPTVKLVCLSNLHSKDHTKHVNKICRRNTFSLIRLIHSFPFVPTVKHPLQCWSDSFCYSLQSAFKQDSFVTTIQPGGSANSDIIW